MNLFLNSSNIFKIGGKNTEIRNFVHPHLQGHLKKNHGLTWATYVSRVKHNAGMDRSTLPMPSSATGDVRSTSAPTEKAPEMKTSPSPKVSDIL